MRKTGRCGRSSWAARSLGVIAVVAMIGISLPGTAQARSGKDADGGSLRPAVSVVASSESASSKECFYTFPTCTSSDPNVKFSIVSVGDTTGCESENTVDWGDGSSDTLRYNGEPNGDTLVAFLHTYTDRPRTYTITITGTNISGGCGVLTDTTIYFDLAAPSSAVCPRAASTAAPDHAARAAARPGTAGENGWIGYIAVSGKCTFTSVTGEWFQPPITCPKQDEGTTEADFWVGLDGYDGSHTIEQTGIEAECVWSIFGGYKTTYKAWYEMFPDGAMYNEGFENLNPRAGSLVKATVIYYGNGVYRLDLAVSTDGDDQSASTEQTCDNACKNTTAEWVVEKVKEFDFADFKIWVLYNGYATTASDNQEQSVQSLHPTRDTKTEAVPTSLNGASFTVVTRS
jgi:Peptidase A4 family